MSTTARNIIEASLTELGIIAAGETAAAADMEYGRTSLNRVLDQMAAERIDIYTITRTNQAIISGTSVYTVGAGGDIDIVRPVFVDHVNFQDTSVSPTLEYQMQPLTDDAWSKVPQKDLQSPLPSSWYWNPTMPLATLTLWPVPTSATLEVVIYAWTAIVAIAPTALSESRDFPPGYERMLVKNLSLELAPSYSRQLDPMLVRQADDSKMAVRRANKRLLDLSFDLAALIKSGDNRFFWDIRVGP